MGTCLTILGIFSIIDNQIVIIVFAVIFVAAFNFGFGPVLWVYTSEVLDDKG